MNISSCMLLLLQGQTIRLETANAALLERSAASWEEALCEEPNWNLVELVTPDTPAQS